MVDITAGSHSAPAGPDRVQAIFQHIANVYDPLNQLLSLGQHHAWRRRAAALADPQPGESVLDVCCGTGDMVWALLERQPHLGAVVGLDVVPAMLERATAKFARRPDRNRRLPSPIWVRADARRLPFADNSFDVTACAFGIRNVAKPSAALAEMARVLKPGGRLIIAEFDLPTNPLLRWAYLCYFRLVLPAIGDIISGGGERAYYYLPESVCHFRTEITLKKLLAEPHWRAPQVYRLLGGAVLLLLTRKV